MHRRTAKYGGFWQGVTGALNDGETLEAGAARELREETGYAPESILCADFCYQFPLEDAWRWDYHPDVAEIHEHVFLVEIPVGVDPVLSFEHDAFEWASFASALERLKWPNNRVALEVCHRLAGVLSQDQSGSGSGS